MANTCAIFTSSALKRTPHFTFPANASGQNNVCAQTMVYRCNEIIIHLAAHLEIPLLPYRVKSTGQNSAGIRASANKTRYFFIKQSFVVYSLLPLFIFQPQKAA
jgi:hypothetical protein